VGLKDVEAPKEDSVGSAKRLDPKKSYQNFRWLFLMYKKLIYTNNATETIAKICGVSTHTIRRWYKKLNIKMYLEEVRETDRYRDWRTKVLKRDGYRCVRCGTRRDLHAHHIKPWAKYPKQRYLVANGETLCLKCHQKRHPLVTLLFESKS